MKRLRWLPVDGSGAPAEARAPAIADSGQPKARGLSGPLAALVFVLTANVAHAIDARAWLDRNSMHMGETVTLNVEISGDTSAGQPDLSALRDDFDMLGTQSSSSVNIVNGQTSSKLLWAVGLQPKHSGTITIPAFNVANARTEPLTLTVLPAPAGAVGKSGDDLFVQVDALPRQPYVQQEIRLTVKLYYALSLIDGNLEDPKADGLVVRKLGQDSNYVADVDGRRYRVVERHYAASAENSGTLQLPPIVFRGRGLDPGDVNSFFSRGRSVSAQSEPIALDVRARPPASGNDVWLPAQSLTLSVDGIDPAKPAHAGEPLTLTLHLKAQGLGFEQLPELRLPTIDGADIYPDKETTQNRDDGSWLYGSRERKFAVVPQHSGKLALPAFTIGWWDAVHDKAQTSEVPAQTIEVLPAQGGATPMQVAPTPTPSEPSTAAVPPAAPIGATSDLDLRRWQLLAITGFGLWALTLAGGAAWWWRRRRRRPAPEKAPQRGAGSYEFRSSCARADLSGAARALLRQARRDRPALRNLGELARAVDDAGQASLIQELERAMYGGASADDTLARRLGDAFKDGPSFPAAKHAATATALPELYPFRI